MARWLTRCLLAVIVSLYGATNRAEAAACTDKKTAIFSLNGIWVSPESVNDARDQLKRQLSQILGCEVPVIIAFNTPEGTEADLEESLDQWLRQHNLPTIDSELFWLIIGGAKDVKNANYPSAVVRVTQFFADEIARNIVELEGGLTDQQRIDLNTHLGMYRIALNAQFEIVLVGHSQGNFFANVEYDVLLNEDSQNGQRVHAVALATPANRVAGHITGASDRHTTVNGDFIHHVPGALDPNVTAQGCESQSPPGSVTCHLMGTYLKTANKPWQKVAFDILAETGRIAVDDSYGMQQGTIFQTGVNVGGVTDNDRVPTGTLGVTFIGTESIPGFTTLGGGAFRLDLRNNTSFVGLLRFEYVLESDFGHSNIGVVEVHVAPASPPPNQPPTAGFSMSVPSQIVISPGTLSVVADPTTGKAEVMFHDASSDPDPGDSLSRTWTTNTGVTLSIGGTQFPYGFDPGGPYIVTLTVTDRDGLQATSEARITVVPAPTISTLANTGMVPEGSVDLFWTLASGPTCPAGNCPVFAAVNDGFPFPAWSANSDVSKWIEPISSTTDTHPAGQYVYRTTFIVDGPASGLTVTGRWAADDGGSDILVNGISTGFRTELGAYHLFSITSGLKTGVNTLDFVVTNVACNSCNITNPVGLRVEFGAESSGAPLVIDNFDDNTIDPRLWNRRVQGLGPTVAEADNRLEIMLPSTSTEDPIQRVFSGGYSSVCQLRGDFDIQVEYRLIDWPFANGVRVGLGTGLGATERTSFGSAADFPGQPRRETYITHFQDGLSVVSTTDAVGVLRQVRVGNVVSGYYREVSDWVQIGSATASTADVGFSLSAWSHAYAFTASHVQVAFDDLVLNSGTLICPSPPSLVFDGSSEGGFARATFDEPQIDSRGNLIVAKKDPFGSSCGGNFCQPFTIVSLSPTGNVNWEAIQGEIVGQPYVGTDSLGSRGIAIDAEDVVFVAASRSSLAAYKDGVLVPGWPRRVNLFDNAKLQAPFVHPLTGDLYAWSHSGFVSVPSSSVVLTRDGVERLRLTGAAAGPWLLGAGNQPFVSSTTAGTFIQYDQTDLSALCQGSTPYRNFANSPIPLSWMSTEGPIGVAFNTVFKADAACRISDVTSVGGSYFIFATQGDGRVFGFATGGTLIAPSGGELAGVRIADGQTWRQYDVASVGRARFRNGLLYLIGQDRADGLTQKLFVIDSGTGTILRRFDTNGVCDTCGLAVATDGTIYVNDLSSTRIFKIAAITR